MSRVITRRAYTTAGLALGTAFAGLALAPAALAAPAPSLTVSSTTVAPGAEFTISGTGCFLEEGYEVAAVFLPAVDPQWADAVTPEEDGTWAMLQEAPTEPGSYEYALFCDRYTDEFDYDNVTITVSAPTSAPVAPTGAIRGPAANTPGVSSPDQGATGDSAPLGQKIVKILTGFKPGEVVTVTLHSTPAKVGTFTADSAGTVRVEFTVPAGTPVGSHTLVYEGNMGTYFQEAFTVAAAPAAASSESGSGLAYTGADVALPLGLGVGALAVGGGLMLVARRRNAEATQA